MRHIGAHVAIEALDAYYLGSMDTKEVGEVQHHIVFCRDCRERLLTLVRFLEDETPSRFCSAELTSAWEEWLAELRRRGSQKPGPKSD